MRYKIGQLEQAVPVCPGDSINLTITRGDKRKIVHREEVQSFRSYTHWLFMEIEDGIGTAVFMGDGRLEEWFLSQFPNSEKIELEEFLYV